MISPEGAVELNKKTGEIVANGKILDTPQGIYTAEIEREGGLSVKQLHHIRNDRKLRYVLSMSRNEYGANSEKFRRQILEAIGKDDEKARKQLEIHFDEPKADRKNATWTSVCFYLTRDNAILDEKQSIALISPSNGHISKLHHIFRVQNVDSCAPRLATSSESSSSTSDIPMNTLILIAVVGLLIIALLALLVFVCCVSRYQRYLKQKTDRMRCNSSAGSYYKSPNLIPPPPPGYMHTPPLPPPPPPQAIAYY
uniref:CA domain-containing protein n=1 Tax=Caenorhabditis tropicalis TaxID=1561998 RepID=A0A1I7TQD4_9PELO